MALMLPKSLTHWKSVPPEKHNVLLLPVTPLTQMEEIYFATLKTATLLMAQARVKVIPHGGTFFSVCIV